jgi:uncharacterized protein YcfL
MLKYFLVILSLFILAACIHEHEQNNNQQKPIIEDLIASQLTTHNHFENIHFNLV